MRYEDFIVSLTAGPGDGFTVRTSSALAGEGEGRLSLQVSSADLERLAEGIFRTVEAGRGARQLSAVDIVESPEPSLRALGGRLFQGLFSERIRSRYDQSLGRLGEREDCGLRIKIQMSLDDQALARLHGFPWEYLYRGEDRTFLGLGRQTSIVRYLSLPLPGDRPPLPLPLRILAVVAEPMGQRPLSLAREIESLKGAWGAHGGVEVVFLREATLDRLRAMLLTRKFHVLHFMGHGDFDPVTGEGVLCLEDEARGTALVRGEDLADQLRDFISLRLVFLNACQTARAAASGPFAGVATALLQAGIPAVIAMQFPISDQAAIAFSGEVYRFLAMGEPVDTAVAEGRLAIARRLPSSLEWGTPVLFLRAPDGRIFQPAPAAMPAATQDVGRPAPARMRRPAGIAALAAGILLAAGIGLFPRLHKLTAAQPVTTFAQPVRQPERQASPPPPGAERKTVRPAAKQASRPKEPEPPVAKAPGIYDLSDGQTLFLPELNAYVSARFEELYGQTLVSLSLTPKGASTAFKPPILGATTLDFDTADGPRSIAVMTIDWGKRGLKIRPISG
jgi:hypothetical protein